MIAFLFSVLLSYAPNAEAGCGLGCQRQMGNCTVDSQLWNAAASSGYKMNSCCRSPEYNARLRSCGYQPARNSSHMTGRAVDLNVPPRLCNSRYLKSIGFPDVCPIYHNPPHCHVAMCGTQQTYRQARETGRRQIRQIRQRNRRAVHAPVSYYEYNYDNPAYSRRGQQTQWNNNFFWNLFSGGVVR